MNRTLLIKIHFINPRKIDEETKNKHDLKWFTGWLSGHVGIEYSFNRILDFVSQGSFHWIAQRKKHHSQFNIRTRTEFLGLFGQDHENTHGITITIPVSFSRQQKLATTARKYVYKSPYDYAFVGMRCASATYEILARAGILKPFSLNATAFLFPSPLFLKIYLLRIAHKKHWKAEKF